MRAPRRHAADNQQSVDISSNGFVGALGDEGQSQPPCHVAALAHRDDFDAITAVFPSDLPQLPFLVRPRDIQRLRVRGREDNHAQWPSEEARRRRVHYFSHTALVRPIFSQRSMAETARSLSLTAPSLLRHTGSVLITSSRLSELRRTKWRLI